MDPNTNFWLDIHSTLHYAHNHKGFVYGHGSQTIQKWSPRKKHDRRKHASEVHQLCLYAIAIDVHIQKDPHFPQTELF